MRPTKEEWNEAVRMVGEGQAAMVLPHLESWLEGMHAVGPVHSLCLQALISLGKRRQAIALLEDAIDLGAATADGLDALAFFAMQLDRHELSNELYRRATELAPGDPQFWYNYATSERSIGRLAGALEACGQALALDPDMRPVILLRSELTRATPTCNNVADLEARIARCPDDPDTMFLSYALGKELHELGYYEQAFAAFSRGAAARRQKLHYDVTQDELKLQRIAAAFGTARNAPPRTAVDRHIFIIGLPRSGTTLTERILGGLPGVRSNNETNNFSTALFQNIAPSGGDIFDRAANASFEAVATDYRALAGSDESSSRIIEKLPFNYLYVGAILRTFPHAPVIWVRRDPIDSCFAMFRTLFGAAYPFSYDFDELARYYAAYDRLMRHWADLYGDRLICVDYETLVAAPEKVGPQLAARCDLSWSDVALDLTQNRSVSLSASAAQVRHGIYATSSGIWRRYAKQLAPLAERLAAHGIRSDGG